MTAQFWWGLAMLPLGTIGLAITIVLPFFAIYKFSDWRRDHAFTWAEKNDKGRWNDYMIASLVAIGKWSRVFILPLNYRVIIMRDRPGCNANADAARDRITAVRDALRQQDDKEAE